MKTDTFKEGPESCTVALLTGLSIGLGIVVHTIFFLAAAVVLLIVPVRRFAEYVYQLEEKARGHRHA